MSTVTQTLTSRKPLHSAPAANKSNNNNDLLIKIDDVWIDLTQWQHSHPGGSQILQYLNGQDATDAFYALHSKEAIARLKRFPKTNKVPLTSGSDDSKSQIMENVPEELIQFRKFRQQLEADGWFDRNYLWDSFYLFMVYGLCVVGSYLCLTGYTFLSIILLGIAMQQAGWVGHDYSHGRGKFSYVAGHLTAGLVNGFSTTWWSDKHNTHHCYTNHVGIDADIQNDPVFHLFFPSSSENDVSFRKYQHLYFVPVAAVLYISWRVQSLMVAIKKKKFGELFFITINYLWIFFVLGWQVGLAATYLGGGLVAVIVTASHQSEEMFDLPLKNYNYVRTQFESTRDATTSNFFTEYLWGGMQYQLEHHLFPIMPKYRYASVVPLVRKFAEENNLPYKSESEWELLVRNYETLKYYSQPLSAVMKQN